MAAMATRKVSVAYEDPRHDKAEARYFGLVRRKLDDMGAPNSGELLHNSEAFASGQYRARVPADTTAAVIWHQHCGKGQKETVPVRAFREWMMGEIADTNRKFAQLSGQKPPAVAAKAASS